MVLISAMALLIAVFFLLSYHVTVVRQNRESNRKVTEICRGEYEKYMAEAEELIDSPKMREFLTGGTSSSRSAVSRMLYDAANSGEIRARFVVTDSEGEPLMSNFTKGNLQTFASSLMLKRVISRMSGDPGGTMSLLCDVDLTEDQRCAYSIVCAIPDGSGRIAGYVFLNMRNEDLEAIAGSMGEEIVILDQYDNAIFSSIKLPGDPGDKLPTRRFTADIDGRGVYTVNGTRMYAVKTRLTERPIDVITLTSIERQLYMYRIAAIFFLLTLIVIGILMMLMTRLYTGINERGIGEFMKDLEVRNLEEKFNPHFVFNVMESVYFQIDEDPKKAQDMLMAFSSLMRYSINYGQSRVTLETDVNYLNDFLMLQKIRYNQLLTYKFDIPDELLDTMVPKLILQPLIENCVRHGFVSGQELHIDISARQEGEDIIFEIRDNGRGITEEKLLEIRESFGEDVAPETVKHIGLYNVEKILSKLYGDRYGLDIASRPGEGTVVTLRMPCETEDENV